VQSQRYRARRFSDGSRVTWLSSFDVDELMAMENVKEIVRIVEGKLGGQ